MLVGVVVFWTMASVWVAEVPAPGLCHLYMQLFMSLSLSFSVKFWKWC